MLTAMEVNQYLERIQFDGDISPSSATLTQLHLQHLLHAPFENLDIVIKRPFKLGEKHAFHKIVNERRGGFCYELNYGFYQLLISLGFNVEMLSAQVYNNEILGPPFDHLLLLVKLDGTEYLADVGFGDGFNEPLQFNTHSQSLDIQSQAHANFAIFHQDNHYLLQRQENNEDWKDQFVFTTQPRTIADFADMFDFHQYNQDSGFAKKLVCSKLTPTGRITLSNHEKITTIDGEKNKLDMQDEKELTSILKSAFGVQLPEQDNENLAAIFARKTV